MRPMYVIVSFAVCCCIARIYVTTVAVLLICVLSLYFAGCILLHLYTDSCVDCATITVLSLRLRVVLHIIPAVCGALPLCCCIA